MHLAKFAAHSPTKTQTLALVLAPGEISPDGTTLSGDFNGLVLVSSSLTVSREEK